MEGASVSAVQTPATGKVFKAQVSQAKKHVLLVSQVVHKLISRIIVWLLN
jgi:hypothetical protein